MNAAAGGGGDKTACGVVPIPAVLFSPLGFEIMDGKTWGVASAKAGLEILGDGGMAGDIPVVFALSAAYVDAGLAPLSALSRAS